MEQKLKEKLTWEEMAIFDKVRNTPGAILRNYGALLYRLQDKDFNPIKNYKRSDIEAIQTKGWIKRGPDGKVTIL